MSGKQYKVFMVPSAHRRYKKFNADLQSKLKEEAEQKIPTDPGN